MKVQHKKTGRTAEVLSQDEKLVRIKFDENGEEQNMMISTYKRWWKVIDDSPVENPMTEHIESVEVKEVKPVDDDKCGDGTPLAEVGKEILEQAKQKANDAKQSAKIKDRSKTVTDFLNACGYSVTHNKDGRVIWAKSDGKKALHITLCVNKFVLGLKEEDVPAGRIPDRIRNCTLTHAFDIEYDKIDSLKSFM